MVIVDDPAKYLSALDGAGVLWFSVRNGAALLDALMRPSCVVVVIDELSDDSPQMGLVQDENMIQTLFADSSDPALRVSICIGRPEGSGNDNHAFASEDGVEIIGELAVIVADQESQGEITSVEFPNNLSGLLGDPELIGIGGDASQMHLARAQFDEEEHIDGL